MTKEQKEACRVVENLLRSLGGKNVQVCVMPDLVSVAPVEWAGDSTGTTLAEALADAIKGQRKHRAQAKRKGVMICPSCGGIVGRDCFNPEECAAIGHAQEQQRRRATDVHGDALALLLSQVANLEARVQHLEKLTNANP